MSVDRSLERLVADALAEEAPMRGPDRLADSVLAVTAHRRPRPRWLTLMQEPSMDLDRRSAFGSASVRSLGTLAAVLVLAMLAVGTVVAGAPLLARPVALIPPDRGAFTPTDSMEVARELPSATLLQDGRVLVVGGYGGVSDGVGSYPYGTEALASAELWDPATGKFQPAGSMTQARQGHTATLLPDGRVLVVGGGPDATYAELWDPATMSFRPTGSPAVTRFGARATLLPDGRVLIAGGGDGDGTQVTSAEVWDADTGTFSAGDALPEAGYPAGTVLEDGKVLVFDGDISVPGDTVKVRGPRSASVWDPATGTSTPAGALTVPHGLEFTTTVLLDGRVLVVGGDGCPRRGVCSKVAVAEIWDAATMSFSATGPLGQARMYHAAVLLRDGRVLVVGDSLGGRGDSAEVFELR